MQPLRLRRTKERPSILVHLDPHRVAKRTGAPKKYVESQVKFLNQQNIKELDPGALQDQILLKNLQPESRPSANKVVETLHQKFFSEPERDPSAAWYCAYADALKRAFLISYLTTDVDNPPVTMDVSSAFRTGDKPTEFMYRWAYHPERTVYFANYEEINFREIEWGDGAWLTQFWAANFEESNLTQDMFVYPKAVVFRWTYFIPGIAHVTNVAFSWKDNELYGIVLEPNGSERYLKETLGIKWDDQTSSKGDHIYDKLYGELARAVIETFFPRTENVIWRFFQKTSLNIIGWCKGSSVGVVLEWKAQWVDNADLAAVSTLTSSGPKKLVALIANAMLSYGVSKLLDENPSVLEQLIEEKIITKEDIMLKDDLPVAPVKKGRKSLSTAGHQLPPAPVEDLDDIFADLSLNVSTRKKKGKGGKRT